jgi:predicted transcriptional regulator
VELLQGVLSDAKAAIVEEGDRVVAIVTRIDLIDFFSKQAAGSASASLIPGPI